MCTLWQCWCPTLKEDATVHTYLARVHPGTEQIPYRVLFPCSIGLPHVVSAISNPDDTCVLQYSSLSRRYPRHDPSHLLGCVQLLGSEGRML